MKWTIWGVFLFAFAARADVPALVQKVVELRAEVESLGRELETDQKQLQAELELWSQKRLELESSLQKERLRRIQMEERLRGLSQRVNAESKANPGGRSALKEWINRAQESLDRRLPFRREARAATLKSLAERAERGHESVEALAGELWQFYEDEFKMAFDNEYRVSDVTLAAAPVKAEIVRLGLYRMYLRPAGGDYRVAVQTAPGTWDFPAVSDSSRGEVDRLFRNMKAKKESGLYALPAMNDGGNL